MATIGNAFEINAAVSNSRTSTGTLYTAPATGFAIVNLATFGGGASTFTVDGRRVHVGTESYVQGIYVGPSQVLAVTIGGGETAQVSGVEFVNA